MEIFNGYIFNLCLTERDIDQIIDLLLDTFSIVQFQFSHKELIDEIFNCCLTERAY